jgi:hypothetical protein
MGIKTKDIFGVAIAAAVGSITFVNVRDNYDSIKDKSSNILKKVFFGSISNSKEQYFDNEGKENE